MNCSNRRTFLLLLLIGLSVSGGCGTNTYNDRLNHTKKLFNYINELKANLGILWNNAGVEIRMPRQYTEIPPPEMVLNEQGELVQVGEDERQPAYSSVELPGLIGAWEGRVETLVGENEVQAAAYAYIMSNAYLLAKGEEADALSFPRIVLDDVAVGLSLPEFDDEGEVITYPQGTDFIPQHSARVWVRQTEAEIDENQPDVEYDISIHLLKNEKIQVAVLFVYPKNFTTRERMSKRIDLALETIKISPELPRGAATTTAQPSGDVGP